MDLWRESNQPASMECFNMFSEIGEQDGEIHHRSTYSKVICIATESHNIVVAVRRLTSLTRFSQTLNARRLISIKCLSFNECERRFELSVDGEQNSDDGLHAQKHQFGRPTWESSCLHHFHRTTFIHKLHNLTIQLQHRITYLGVLKTFNIN